MRTPFIAGNWKMHLDRAAIDAFCGELRGLAEQDLGTRIGVFPPFVYLPAVVEALSGSDVVVGSQTCRPEAEGAFTGEVAAGMVKDVGASHVIVGHSERRQLFGETDADVRARLDAALAVGLDVVFCLGETFDERQAEQTADVVSRQLQAGITGLDGETLGRRVTIAYEPVWAIGTGLTATPAQAQEVHALLRKQVADLAGQGAADATVIQYGGSVKPDNIAELMECADVDGALVGGASLQPASFEAIVRLGKAASRGAGRA